MKKNITLINMGYQVISKDEFYKALHHHFKELYSDKFEFTSGVPDQGSMFDFTVRLEKDYIFISTIEASSNGQIPEIVFKNKLASISSFYEKNPHQTILALPLKENIKELALKYSKEYPAVQFILVDENLCLTHLNSLKNPDIPQQVA